MSPTSPDSQIIFLFTTESLNELQGKLHCVWREIKEAPFGIDVSELHLPSWLLFFALHPYTENKNTDVIETQDPIIASAVLTCPLLLPVSGKLV